MELACPYTGAIARRALREEFDAIWYTGAATYRRALRGVARVARKAAPRSMVRDVTTRIEQSLVTDSARRLGGRMSGMEGGYLLRRFDPELSALVSRLAMERQPCAVIAEFLWNAIALDNLSEPILRMVDTHDIQHRRRAQARSSGGDMTGNDCTLDEEQLELSRADTLIAIQLHERAALQELLPCHDVITVEHTLTANPQEHQADSQNILFVGNLYDPNVVGIERFIEEVWPEVRQHAPGATLTVCGTVCDGVHGPMPGGVSLAGPVTSLEPYYARAAVVINPVPYGTGLKIKTVESLVYGRCLVSTPAGVLGLETGTDTPLPVTVCALGEMAPAIVELLGDPEKRRAAEAQAVAYAAERFAPDRVYGALFEAVERGQTPMEGFRERRDFTRMLLVGARDENVLRNGAFRPVPGGKLDPWAVTPNSGAVHLESSDAWHTVTLSTADGPVGLVQSPPWDGADAAAVHLLAWSAVPYGLTVALKDADSDGGPIASVDHPGDGRWHCVSLRTIGLAQRRVRRLSVEIRAAQSRGQEPAPKVRRVVLYDPRVLDEA